MEEDNEVKIADKEVEVYIGECVLRFQSNDQIMLSAKLNYRNRLEYIADVFSGVGIVPQKKYLDEQGKLKLLSIETEMLNQVTGRREKKTLYKLGLTKIPTLFMFTDPDKALDFPELKETKETKKKTTLNNIKNEEYEIQVVDREIRFYLGRGVQKFKTCNLIVFSAVESFVEKMRYSANILNAIGIVIDKKYLGPTGKMKFLEEEGTIVNKSTGRKEKKIFYKLGLTKVDELLNKEN